MAKGFLTKVGRLKLCKAHAGEIILPKVSMIAVGSGGVDPEGNCFPITGDEVELRNELLRKVVSKCSFPEPTTCRFTLRLEEDELASMYISEAALIDAEGDVVMYKNFMPKGKDGDMAFVLDIDECFPAE